MRERSLSVTRGENPLLRMQNHFECGILFRNFTGDGERVLGQMREKVKNAGAACGAFLKWLALAGVTGMAVGAAAVAFHWSIGTVSALRTMYPWLVWLLPAGGAATALVYKLAGMTDDKGTNQILISARDGSPVKLRMAPLIFFSTVVTHLVGGSAGREGAALQLGGSMASFAGRRLGLDEKDRGIMVLCGMAGAFSALFGTPITAAVFPMEVVSVGIMHYATIVPCLVSSVAAFLLARALGLHGLVGYAAGEPAALSAASMVQTLTLGVLCAAVSVLFCGAMHQSKKLYAKYIPDPVLRGAAGGAIVLVLTLALGTQLYGGAGDELIRKVLGGQTIWYAFLLKILLTALTMGAGMRGGEIVPALCVGCAFGTWMGPVLGLPHGFAGALGMTAVFCGSTNCPVTSLLLSFELFGGEGMVLFALCSAVSYMLSGYCSLYSEQKIVYSKFRTEWIDKKAT